MPYFPKWFVRPFAKPYVAGESLEEALGIVQTLNDEGFAATMDILGEFVHSTDEANQIKDAYSDVIQRIADANLDSTISVKLTHLGLELDPQMGEDNILALAQEGKENNVGVTIDMENSPFTDQTFEIYNHCKTIYNQVGVVIQSYLHRSLNDVQHLANEQFNSRICKGIYKESEKIAYHEPEKINENFLSIAKSMILKKSFSAYATHDQDLIDQLLNWIETEKISKDLFEFQVLYGVPMGGRLEALLNTGYKVRVYVPYGPDWFDYSVRRLNENPKVISYVMKNIFRTK
jgi:proline dehydrogenase